MKESEARVEVKKEKESKRKGEENLERHEEQKDGAHDNKPRHIQGNQHQHLRNVEPHKVAEHHGAEEHLRDHVASLHHLHLHVEQPQPHLVVILLFALLHIFLFPAFYFILVFRSGLFHCFWLLFLLCLGLATLALSSLLSSLFPLLSSLFSLLSSLFSLLSSLSSLLSSPWRASWPPVSISVALSLFIPFLFSSSLSLF